MNNPLPQWPSVRHMVVGTIITVKNNDQQYEYRLTVPYGDVTNGGNSYYNTFKPAYSPRQMLQLGVFGGCIINDCRGEFPHEWFAHVLLSPFPDKYYNRFGVLCYNQKDITQLNAKVFPRMLENNPDPRGWFQWYCRYYLGRRIPAIDRIQITRWHSIRRIMNRVFTNCHRHKKMLTKSWQILLSYSYNVNYASNPM
jgi:hypothetical protein